MTHVTGGDPKIGCFGERGWGFRQNRTTEQRSLEQRVDALEAAFRVYLEESTTVSGAFYARKLARTELDRGV